MLVRSLSVPCSDLSTPCTTVANGPRAPFVCKSSNGALAPPASSPLISIMSHSNHTFKTLPIRAENTAWQLGERAHKSAAWKPSFSLLTDVDALMLWRGFNGFWGKPSLLTCRESDMWRPRSVQPRFSSSRQPFFDAPACSCCAVEANCSDVTSTTQRCRKSTSTRAIMGDEPSAVNVNTITSENGMDNEQITA